MDYNKTYRHIEDTKDRRFILSPERENAVRDLVKYIMRCSAREYTNDRWESDSLTAQDIVNIFAQGESKEYKNHLGNNIQKIINNEFKSGCYHMLRELLPLMLRMRECLDDFPEGTDIGPKFDNLFYKSDWRG